MARILALIFITFAAFSVAGVVLNLKAEVGGMLASAQMPYIPPLSYVSPKDLAVREATSRPFSVVFDDSAFVIDADETIDWQETYYRSFTRRQEVRPNLVAIKESLVRLSPFINIQPVNGRIYVRDNTIEELLPSQSGRELDMDTTAKNIAQSLEANISSATAATISVPAPISKENAARLGITAKLGSGTTDFANSPEFRSHNIKVGAAKLQSVLLAPGEEFSFNSFLKNGISAEGYKPAYVIKNGRYVLEYGGGLCQVSTTIYRAAMDAGLKITERHHHSLPVQYYTPQGFDATIYPPLVDLRFVNDTEKHVLIQSVIAGTKIAFEIYGQNDGRSVELSEPTVYDRRPSDAFKTVMTRTITRSDGGQEVERFHSVYGSPANAAVTRNPLE